MTRTIESPRSVPSERGTALLVALLFAVTIMAWTASILTSGVAVQKHQRYLGAAQQAHDAAESGVHLLVAHLMGPESAELRASRTLAGTLRGTGPRAQRFQATLEPAGDDGVDNDVDGLVDEEDEADMFEVTSTGRYDNVSRTVRVTLLARYRTPGITSAAYIADSLATLKLNGADFLISGYDVDLAGSPTGNELAGIGVAGSATYIKSQIEGKTADQVVGKGGTPSVEGVAALDLGTLIEDGARSANVVLNADENGAVKMPEEAEAWGTLEVPALVFGSGDFHISGAGKGVGILIVDGNLTISGAFEWEGIIIVRGELVFAGGGSTKRIRGAVIVEEAVRTNTSSGRSNGDVTIGGTVDIQLSQDTVTKVRTVFATYTMLNWREGGEETAP